MNTNLCLFRCLKTTLMALTLALPFSGWAQFNYTINNGAVTITKFNDSGSAGNVVIPATLGGFPVKNIGPNAFDTGNFLSSLTGVTIPNSVTNIGSYAFNYCYNVTNLTIGNGVTTIGDEAFANCASLTNVTLPNSAVNLGYSLFYQCSALTNVILPTGLTRIPSALFFFCGNLTSVTIPAGVKIIELEAFLGCSHLTNVVIPNQVTNIASEAFQYCSGLTNVTIPNSVVSIGDGAFSSCFALPSVTIPASVTSIGDQAFWFCTSLTNISVNGMNPNYSSINGVLFNKAGTVLVQYPVGRAGGYTVPLSVTNIPANGFYYCPYLTSIILPSGITTISTNTFWYNAALTNVVIPSTVTSIGYSAFTGCFALTSVALPSNLTSIGDLAFIGCSSLTSVTIPAGVTNIGVDAFYTCTALQQAYFLGNAPTVDGTAGSDDSSVFSSYGGTAFYTPGTTGWGATYGSWPTVAATYQPQPQILRSGQGFGVNSNPFHFTISWATNTSVVVEASTNLVNWAAIATNQLASGTNAFADASSTNYPRRFYRVRSF